MEEEGFLCHVFLLSRRSKCQLNLIHGSCYNIWASPAPEAHGSHVFCRVRLFTKGIPYV